MAHDPKKPVRIIGVSPSGWGFGFAVLDGNNVLVDWDAKTASKDKNARCIKEVAKLIHLYAPDAMALFDYSAGSKRSLRVEGLNRRLIALAKGFKIKAELFTQEKVAQLFFPDGCGTKHDIAKVLAERFSDELGFRLPPKRAAWMRQDRRMDIFDAVALAVAIRLREKKAVDPIR